MRKRLLVLLLVIGVGTAGIVWKWRFADSAGESGRQAKAAVPSGREAAAPEKRIAAVAPRSAIGDARGDAFAPRQWTPEAPAVSTTAQPAAPAPPPPAPYRYAGKVVREGAEEILLAKGDVLVPVRVGENLEGGYRVESIDAEWIVLRHVPTGARQRVVVNSALDAEVRR